MSKYIINRVAEELGVSKTQARKILNTVTDVIAEAIVKGEKVYFPKIGKFVIKDRKARRFRNPKTGEIGIIPEHKTVVFRPSKKIKESFSVIQNKGD